MCESRRRHLRGTPGRCQNRPLRRAVGRTATLLELPSGPRQGSRVHFIMKQPLQKLIASRYGGRNIPVALVLPDGGRVALSKTPEIDIYRPHLERAAGARFARARQARPRLRPQRHRLHRRGPARAGHRRGAGRHRRARPRPRHGAAQALVAHGARQPGQHPASLRRLERVLPDVARRAHGLFVRVFQDRRATRSTRRRRRSSITSAAS